MRQRKHPLSQRTLGQYFICERCRGLGHAPRTARGAEPALLAAERDQFLSVAPIAAQAQETLLEPPALQVSLKLLLSESWKRPASLGTQLAKRGIVLLDELIQQRRFG
jgi:hypothetical protein